MHYTNIRCLLGINTLIIVNNYEIQKLTLQYYNF